MRTAPVYEQIRCDPKTLYILGYNVFDTIRFDTIHYAHDLFSPHAWAAPQHVITNDQHIKTQIRRAGRRSLLPQTMTRTEPAGTQQRPVQRYHMTSSSPKITCSQRCCLKPNDFGLVIFCFVSVRCMQSQPVK